MKMGCTQFQRIIIIIIIIPVLFPVSAATSMGQNLRLTTPITAPLKTHIFGPSRYILILVELIDATNTYAGG
jgi:hypothetical protein